jgi:hypothetical protein
MEPTPSFIFDVSQAVWFAFALAGVGLAAVAYRRSRASLDASQAPSPATAKLVYSDVPTVRIVDSQHFERLRKVVSLSPGEHSDILQAHPLVGPRFRITLNAISRNGASDAAQIGVVYCGVQVSCGPLAKELGYNEFLMPRAASDESRSAVFHYQENGNALDFMRIKVKGIDASAGTVELEVMQMRGQWPGGSEVE